MEQKPKEGRKRHLLAVAAGCCFTLGALGGASVLQPAQSADPVTEIEVTKANSFDFTDIPRLSPAIESTIIVRPEAPNPPPVQSQSQVAVPEATLFADEQPMADKPKMHEHTNWLARAQASPHDCVRDLANVASRTRIYFASGQTGLNLEARAQALFVARMAKDCPQAEVSVVGFTDPSGDPDQNMQISWDRANSVLNTLRNNGHPLYRFSAHSHNAVHGPECKHYDIVDRRVEFEVFEIASQ